jgi:hypothetical protein
MEKLNLMGCDVGDEGCIALSEVLCMPQCSIQLLALRFNGITDVGAEAMSRALETNSSLTELGLNSNHITDEGIAALTVRPASEHGCIALSIRATQCISACFACPSCFVIRCASKLVLISFMITPNCLPRQSICDHVVEPTKR